MRWGSIPGGPRRASALRRQALGAGRGTKTETGRTALRSTSGREAGCGACSWPAVGLGAATGVDLVEKALKRARERADEAGDRHPPRSGRRDGPSRVGGRLRLPAAGRHRHLPRPRQGPAPGDGRRGDRRAADDATLLLDCFAPRRRGPLPRGASRADVERAFSGWEISDVEVRRTPTRTASRG